MSIFKKSGEGFLARLFKLKKIDELAEELVHTYADEMQENMLSENAETEQIPMLEVTKTSEVDFDDQPENSEENLPLPTEKSEVRNRLISFRVNDEELEAINKRYAETSFKSRGDFCRYSALTVMNIARYISSISNSFNQVAHRINKVANFTMKILPT